MLRDASMFSYFRKYLYSRQKGSKLSFLEKQEVGFSVNKMRVLRINSFRKNVDDHIFSVHFLLKHNLQQALLLFS